MKIFFFLHFHTSLVPWPKLSVSDGKQNWAEQLRESHIECFHRSGSVARSIVARNFVHFNARKIYIIIFFVEGKKKIQKIPTFRARDEKWEMKWKNKSLKSEDEERNFWFFDLFLFAKQENKLHRDIDGEWGCGWTLTRKKLPIVGQLLSDNKMVN